jgi:hypothetical protein
MRSRLAKLALEAKKMKVAPATVKPDTQYRILESPGCRRVVLTGPKGRVDTRTAESLLWKVCRSVLRRNRLSRMRPLTEDSNIRSTHKHHTAAIMGDQLPHPGTV